ncbi:MAG: hypothetical protein OHK0046_51510 [Anaerolineae bacterium]
MFQKPRFALLVLLCVVFLTTYPVFATPTADAGNNQTHHIDGEAHQVTLDGSGSQALSDFPLVEYKWFELVDGARMERHTGMIYTPTLPIGTYEFVLDVKDNRGHYGSDTVTVIINQKPVALVGDDLVVETLESCANVILDGSGSYDRPETTQPLRYTWDWGTGENTVPTPTLPVCLPEGAHTVTLNVTDVNGGQAWNPAANDDTPEEQDAYTMLVTVLKRPIPQLHMQVSFLEETKAAVTFDSSATLEDTATRMWFIEGVMEEPQTGISYSTELMADSYAVQFAMIYPTGSVVTCTQTLNLDVTFQTGADAGQVFPVNCNTTLSVNYGTINNPPLITLDCGDSIRHIKREKSVTPSLNVTCHLTASDPDNDEMTIEWLSPLAAPAACDLAANSDTQSCFTISYPSGAVNVRVRDDRGGQTETQTTLTLNYVPEIGNLAFKDPEGNAIPRNGNDRPRQINIDTERVLIDVSAMNIVDPDIGDVIVGFDWTEEKPESAPSPFKSENRSQALYDLAYTRGSYEICLTITDSRGGQAERCEDLIVNSKPKVIIDYTPVRRNADQTEDIHLKNNGGEDVDGRIVQYQWRVINPVTGHPRLPANMTAPTDEDGDLITPEAAETDLRKLMHGAYTIQLEVTDDRGGYSTADLSVVIGRCNGVTQIPSAECVALMHLYYSTDGENWANNANWPTTNTPCGATGSPPWFGVGCDANPDESNLYNVVTLTMPFNHLRGELPETINQLTHLRVLNLGSRTPRAGEADNRNLFSVNGIPTPLPAELNKLCALEQLILNNTGIGGNLALFGAGNCLTRLRTISIRNGNLTGELPPQIFNLPALNELILENNRLEGNLRIPSTTNTALSELDLRGNRFTGPLPTQIGNLTGLTELYLSSNSFNGEIPSQIGRLTKLKRLHLQDNALIGDIPDTFLSLTGIVPGNTTNNGSQDNFNICHNALYESAQAMHAYLDARADDCEQPVPINPNTGLPKDWIDYQTLPPTNLTLTEGPQADEITLTWRPPLCPVNGVMRSVRCGRYMIEVFTEPSGGYPVEVIDDPANLELNSSTYIITGVDTINFTYRFRLKTLTDRPLRCVPGQPCEDVVTSIDSGWVTTTCNETPTNISLMVAPRNPNSVSGFQWQGRCSSHFHIYVEQPGQAPLSIEMDSSVCDTRNRCRYTLPTPLTAAGNYMLYIGGRGSSTDQYTYSVGYPFSLGSPTPIRTIQMIYPQAGTQTCDLTFPIEWQPQLTAERYQMALMQGATTVFTVEDLATELCVNGKCQLPAWTYDPGAYTFAIWAARSGQDYDPNSTATVNFQVGALCRRAPDNVVMDRKRISWNYEVDLNALDVWVGVGTVEIGRAVFDITSQMCNNASGRCTADIPLNLPNGTYEVYAQAITNAPDTENTWAGPFITSVGNNADCFTSTRVAQGLRVNYLSSGRPQFEWIPSACTPRYALQLNTVDAAGNPVYWGQYYTPTELGCANPNDNQVCRAYLPVEQSDPMNTDKIFLPNGTNYDWYVWSLPPENIDPANTDPFWVAATNRAAGGNFTVVAVSGGSPELEAPLGSITTHTPTFTWAHVSEAYHYYIEVKDNTYNNISVESGYPEEFTCYDEKCSVTFNQLYLPAGTYNWVVYAETLLANGASSRLTSGTFTVTND